MKKNAATSMATKKDIKKPMSKWLAGGRDSDGKRSRRACRRQPQPQEIQHQPELQQDQDEQ